LAVVVPQRVGLAQALGGVEELDELELVAGGDEASREPPRR
jgi:hypothetical protein